MGAPLREAVQAQRAQALRSRLIGDLYTAGDLADRDWTCAVAAVPREVFLPRFFLSTGERRLWRLVDGADRRWLDLVYRDAPRVTSLRGCTGSAQAVPVGLAAGTPHTVAMAPGLAVYLLHALGDPHPVPRTLHLGEDTYLTALLLARYGQGWVDAVATNPDRAAQAAEALEEAGFPTAGLRLPDGSADSLGTGIYRRILATSPVAAIPARWLEAAHARAVIVTAVRGGLHSPLVRLAVTDDQSAAVGPVLPDTRQLPPTRAQESVDVAAAIGRAAEKGIRRVSIVPAAVLADPAMRLLAGLLMREVSVATGWVDAAPRLWLADTGGATADLDIDRGLVVEAGHRQLWQQVEDIYQRWTSWGRPSRDRFGVTGTPLGMRLWLDEPSRQVAAL